MWLIKMNTSGDTEWTKTFGNINNDHGYGIAVTSDGGYILTGSTNNYGYGNSEFSDIWLIKTDIHGNTLDPD